MVDSDSDGRTNVIYLIDNDKKHRETRSPLLVKIVDEVGFFRLTGEGDLDSDLYVADWYGDGTIDRIVDYRDLDGDNDVDEPYIYQWIEEDYSYYSPKTYQGKSYLFGLYKGYWRRQPAVVPHKLRIQPAVDRMADRFQRR